MLGAATGFARSDAMADLFSEKAKDWDQRDHVRLLSEGIGNAIHEHVRLDTGMRVMDFGAGTGLIASRIVARVGRITAVDVSAAMLDRLAEKPELRDKVEIVCRDILDEPLDARFDLIVSAMAMHHVRDTDALLARFADQLEPGGRVALADLDAEDGRFHPPETEGVFHAGFDRSDLRARLERHGFGEIRFVTAHTVVKEQGSYPVFLVTATKGPGPRTASS